jgi:hypothetical protein
MTPITEISQDFEELSFDNGKSTSINKQAVAAIFSPEALQYPPLMTEHSEKLNFQEQFN